MKRLLTLAALLILAACTSGTKDSYLTWLYRYMPLPDSLGYSRSYWEANVAKTLEVRDLQNWGIPEREFRHFVLPLRVNNETLDDFRTRYADTLCARVKGMSLAQAAVEINHWCHEQATYEPSDSRTSSPTATIRNGVGRCGEESVLAVAALRAAGIPARQVYTPRWAHTDDNHAWVEVWVDGRWHFMGACEPEPRLDMAWFNAPVSRAMLLHTKVFGKYEGDEDIIARNACYTEINVIRGYVPARKTTVTVQDTLGRPVPGATVLFKVYNYAEFHTVASCTSDAQGKASLDTGCGDLLVWATDGGRFGYAVAGAEDNTVVLSHKMGDCYTEALDVVPPEEHPLESGAGAEEIELNARRLAYEDSLRAAHPHDNQELDRFLAGGGDRAAKLVGMLTAKDRKDVRTEVLEDAILVDSEDPYVLNPRVGVEELRPFRQRFIQTGLTFSGPEEAAAWVKAAVKVVPDRNPQGLAIPPASVLESRICDPGSLGTFFVAVCRACGFAARVDEVTGKTQYRENGEWVDISFDAPAAESDINSPKGLLKLTSSGGRPPMYYRHFTIARIDGGRDRLLEFGTDSDETPVGEFAAGVPLDEGYYVLTTGSRMADGSVLSQLSFFSIRGGETTEQPVELRPSGDRVSVIGSFNADPFLDITGRGYFLLAVLGDRDEPTMHARLELERVAGTLNTWGRPVLLYSAGGKSEAVDALSGSGLLSNLSCGADADGSVLQMLLDSCESRERTLPVIAVCDSFGRVVYFSQGYNTSLGADISTVISGI